jgi:hypothetical protein
MRRAASLSLAALVCALLAAGCGGGGASQADRDRAVMEAMDAYHEAKATGAELDHGPCIAERLPGLPDWVADIAHSPRTPVDEAPANQCQRYRTGQAHHFVELTPDGALIRAQ